jgi:hypothetical protein
MLVRRPNEFGRYTNKARLRGLRFFRRTLFFVRLITTNKIPRAHALSDAEGRFGGNGEWGVFKKIREDFIGREPVTKDNDK